MISIIVCSINPEAAERLRQNIAATIGDIPYEMIVFDNRKLGYGICKVYNLCAERSRYDNLCFMHEDVQFDTIDWGKKIVQKLAESNCGAIGFAGIKIRVNGLYGLGVKDERAWRSNYIQHRKNQWYMGSFENPLCSEFSPVVILDGMCLFVSRKVWSEIRFDEKTFSGFHLYDLDFTTAIFKAGYVNYVSHTAIVEHFSEGTYTLDWLKATRDYNEKWKTSLPLYINDLPQPEDMTQYVRCVEFKFIKNLMKRRAKCDWALIDVLCKDYCSKYRFWATWGMKYQQCRYRKKWQQAGLL